MACATIHLAIIKSYLNKNTNIDKKEALKGTLYPDAATDNDKTHYTNPNRGTSNIEHICGKVNLYAFLEEHPTLNDFELGWFIHLVTDYLFFDECFDEEYLEKTTYKDFCKDLHFAYSCLNLYLEEKYHITKLDYESYKEEQYPGILYQDCILPKEMIDNFIERVSSIDFNDYIAKIKKEKRNIKPY